MTILSEEFFPTPPRVISKMLKGFEAEDLASRTILEPSAGNGSIADAIAHHMDRYGRAPQNIYCIENNPELRMVLSGKGYKVIGDDFLVYKSNYLFDLIVMNPPFSNGAAHLLKAWEILNGGDIVCLLNEQTILDPHTKERQLLKGIIEQHGSVEMLGDCFSSAERKTGVRVALVRLHKKEPDIKFDFFEQKTKEAELKLEAFQGENLPAMKDVFGNLEIMYDKARLACADLMKAKSKLKFYIDHLAGENDLGDVMKEDSFNGMLDLLKKKAWDYLFSRTKLAEVMTERVRKDFEEFKKANGDMDFTKENICTMFETIFLNRANIMNQCVLDAFDQLTKYDKQNRVHVEGWKTNDAWKVNRKVIIPYGCQSSYSGRPQMNYSKERDLADIEKALCFVAGEKFEGYNSSISQCVSRGGVSFGEWADSRFFEFKMFKKGTIHLKFKDEWLLQEFNIRAARGKNWLPDDYNEREARANKSRDLVTL